MIETKTNKTISYRIKQIVIGGLVCGVIYYAWNLYQNKKTTTPSTNTD